MRIRIAVVAVLLAARPAPVRGEPWLDTPAWPAHATRMELTWLVHPELPAQPNQLPRAPVELVVSIGDIARTVALAPQVGALRARYQPRCATPREPAAFPLLSGELAKITFDAAGYGGFLVRRAGDDAVAVLGWELEDGACAGKHGEPAPCPRRDKLVMKLHVPAGVTIEERLVRVDARGARRAFACK